MCNSIARSAGIFDKFHFQSCRVKKFESGIISDPVTVSSDITIREVLEITKFNNISGVPVVDNGVTVGIVTNRDLRFETNLDGLMSSVMTPKEKLVTVKEGADEEGWWELCAGGDLFGS